MDLLESLANRVHTLTTENGKEHADAQHEVMLNHWMPRSILQTSVCTAWDELNENTNNLVRQYFLKNHDFSTIHW